MRTSLEPDQAGARLDLHSRTGLDELVVEVPDAPTAERLEVLATVRASWP